VAVSGTTNTVAKFTSATTIGNSNITDNGTLISLGSDTAINGFTSGTVTKVLPAGNNFGSLENGATGNFTGSANGWNIISRQTWNINDDAFTYNGLTANDIRIIVNRSTTSVNGYVAFQGLINNSGTATQGAQFGIFIANTAGNGNFGTVVGYKAGATGPPTNTGTYTNYIGFETAFLPQNIANFYGLNINDHTATTISRAVNLSLSAGTGKFNIYAGGTANNFMAGSLGIGTTSLTGFSLYVAKSLTGATTTYGVIHNGIVQSDVTSASYGFTSQSNTQAAAFTLTDYQHFFAQQNTIGAGSSITNQSGFIAHSSLIGATNNYGFRGQIPVGTGRWNLFMEGMGANFLAGDTGIGTTTLGTATQLTVGGTETAVSAISRGQLINTTLVASANNDALVGLDINPTFTNGAFANNLNVAIRSLNHAAKFSKLLIGSLTVPTLNSAVGSASGGTLPAATYFYRIVAYDAEGLLTTASNELSVVTTGSTSSVALSWSLVQGAAGYRVYKSNVSNSYSSYISVFGVNTTTLTDTNQAVTSGTIPAVNNSSYGLFDSTRLRTNNITLVNNGVGQFSSLTFEKSTDGASMNVVEYAFDQTMYEFKMTDNPDSVEDFFHWFVADWQNASSGWKPLKFAGFTSQFVGQNSNFWSSFSLPASTPYFTTNPDNLANAAIKGDPYTSTAYNLVKENGSGTGTLNVDVTGFTGSSNRIYWVTITSSTTFNWGLGSWTGTPSGTNVTITGAFQTLDSGVQVRLSVSGQLAGDRWAFRAFPVPRMGIGTTTPTAPLQVSTTVRPTSGTATGVFFNPTLVATANNDTLVGLDINPTFTNGAFTGVTNTAIRVAGNIIPSTDNTRTLGLSNFRWNNIYSAVIVVPSIYTRGIYSDTAAGVSILSNGGTRWSQWFETTGNLLIQNGGTYTEIPSARLAVNSTTQGFLPPRMTAAQRLAIASPETGLIVYQTDGVEGLWVKTSTSWREFTFI
jgi:hypothetical protein